MVVTYKTLFDSGLTDFKKILFCLPVIVISAVPVLGEPKALAVAILIQGVSNIDGYWDFLKEDGIYSPLKKMLYFLVFISVVAGVLGILSLVGGYRYFDTSYKTGCIVTAFALLAVSFPVILLATDWKLNAINQENRTHPPRQTEGEDDEL